MPIKQLNKKYIHGLSLIEVLIASFLFSIGALSISSLTVAGLRIEKNTQTSVEAELLANNILETIRTNKDSAQDYHNYDTSDLNNNTPRSAEATDNLRIWKSDLESKLPIGQGTIVVNNNKRVEIEIKWRALKIELPNDTFKMVSDI